MGKVTIQGLEECFLRATEYGNRFVGVAIETKGYPGLEVIINREENFKVKLEYYKKAYDNNLVLKTFAGIRIVGFATEDNFDELQFDLLN